MLFIVIPDVLFLISSYFRYQPGNLLPYGRDLLGGRSGQKISGRVLTRVKEIGKSPSSRIFNVGFWGKGGWGRFYCLSWLASVSVSHVCKAQVLQICKNSQNWRDYEYIGLQLDFSLGSDVLLLHECTNQYIWQHLNSSILVIVFDVQTISTIIPHLKSRSRWNVYPIWPKRTQL